MNKELQRIKIAEACGWRQVPCPESSMSGHSLYGPEPMTFWRGEWGLPDETIGIPDYLNDLNAMHEAEDTFGDPQLWMEYDRNLAVVMDHVGWHWHATALQRCEAFLRTLSLWTPTGEENE